MRSFLLGVVAGAAGLWLWLHGVDPIYQAVVGMWQDVSRPPAADEP